MACVKRQMMVFLIIGMMAAAPLYSDCYAEETDVEHQDISVGSMMYDTLLLRPAGIAATVVGFGVFVVSLPFSAAFKGDIRKTFDLMVVDPAVFTFKRPLGKF